MSFQLNTIDEALDSLKAGKVIIVVDDEDRENEGDFVAAAETITPEIVNFFVKHGRGILCASITAKRAEELHLEPIVENNTSLHETPFTVPIDYLHGTTTGVSASDRALTIKAITHPTTKANDFGRPGHIFPLRSVEGGVLQRAGHTEAVVDLCRLAGLYPAGALVEIMNEDGTMARVPELVRIAEKFDLKIVSIKDLVEYRQHREKLVEKVVSTFLPTQNGKFDVHLYKSSIDDKEHVVLLKGVINVADPVLVRVHSECLTGDVFGSQRCDCNEQLHTSLAMIEKEGTGIVLYMRQEGRGIGLLNKLRAYKLQDEGKDTVEANEALGFHADVRDYSLAAQILLDLGIKKVKLLTNNPKKIVGLKGFGIEVVERVPIEVKATTTNEKYLKTKRDKMGHLILTGTK
ncbi:MAG: bifunctional 3,4-dihydroxy-2-butanone-4-phosphate synthase/GTP cyclohydrolase II [Ignavibacteriales bacterium]|nr:bifunctional 3,4-dihydroxy-2-butanone-4-phosphate synthase/GTP cyclohydrolase II [Ignavibacteriales bacterium]